MIEEELEIFNFQFILFPLPEKAVYF